MASDKVQYYMERVLPELKELEQKGVFTQPEISAIIQKRTKFEFAINASGSSPRDYMRYLEFELNMYSLRQKRLRRLRGVKLSLTRSSDRRILFLLERATSKFPGDLNLWMAYLEHARKLPGTKVMDKALMGVLRMHPMQAKFWIYAAVCAVDDRSDVAEARSYLQRGLRFNKRSKELWVEYAKLEMVFVAKVLTRRRILGIGASKSRDGKGESADGGGDDEDEEMKGEGGGLEAGLGEGRAEQQGVGSEGSSGQDEFYSMDEDGRSSHGEVNSNQADEVGGGAGGGAGGEEAEADVISLLPEPEGTEPEHTIESLSVENESNPALNGALSLAIFDAATREIPNNVEFANDFFNVFSEFGHLHFCPTKVLPHVISYAQKIAPKSPTTWFMVVRAPIVGIEPRDPIYPSRVRAVLGHIREAVDHAQPLSPLYDAFVKMMVDIALSETDEGVRVAATGMAIRYLRRAEDEGAVTPDIYLKIIEVLRERKVRAGNVTEADVASRGALRFPGHEGLRSITAKEDRELPS